MDGPDPKGNIPLSPPRASLTETLLKFTEPVLSFDDPDFSAERLEIALQIATLVWNAEVAREISGDESTLAEAKQRMQGMPQDLRETLVQMIDLLSECKREDFPGDLRAVGGVDIGPVGTDGRPRVRVHEVDVGALLSGSRSKPRSQPSPRAERKPKRYVVDMRHSLPDDGLMGNLPRPARVLANHFGAIIAAASRAASNFEPSDVPCRKRTGAQRCPGQILLHRARPEDRIDWECASCREAGTIQGWRGTPWDLTHRKRDIAALPAHERLRIRISDAERRALELALGLHTDSIAALAAARPATKGWTLEAARAELEDLAVAAAAEIVEGQETGGSTRYYAIAERIHRALGIDEALDGAAETAGILCFRARAERRLIRGVARVEGCGVHRLAVVLDGVEPAVRRELLVRSDTTLEELHALLQVAFGWTESHLHAFRIGRARYMRKDQSEDMDARHSHVATLIDVVPKAGDVLVYEYDFGDSWTHSVQVAEVRPTTPGELLPRCLSGEGAAPPEDVGGAGGYADLLEILADPTHPEHDDRVEWLGHEFDPRAFELGVADCLIRQLGRWQAASTRTEPLR